MLKPMLVQISLQNRGEVITERRVRLDESDAHRVYNALEALLLTEAEAPDWPAKLWVTVNRRRGELIDKKLFTNRGPLTTEEQAELATLQEYADAYLARFDVPKVEALEALEVKPADDKIAILEWAIGQKDKQLLEFSDEVNRRGEWLSDATASEAEQVNIIGPTENAIHNINAILQRRRKINAERGIQ